MIADALVELRAMEADDLPEVHRLEVASSPDPWSFDLLAEELAGQRSDRHWLVATEAAPGSSPVIVAFGGVLLVVGEAHIMNLVVDPTRRRRGLASRLLAALLFDAADLGATAATLEVRTGNVAAVELYRRFGFEVAGRRPGYYADGEDAEIMWCHGIDRPDRVAGFAAIGGIGGGDA